MKFLILLVIFLACKIKAAEVLDPIDTQVTPQRHFPTYIEEIDELIVLNLDGKTLVNLSKTNRYLRDLLSPLWKNVAAKILGVPFPIEYPFYRSYVSNNHNFTFQDIAAIDASDTRLLLADDGSTVVLPMWNHPQQPKTTIIKRMKRHITLRGCYANVISPTGDIVAGWYTSPEVGCTAFRWTEKKGLELLPIPSEKSIAFQITQKEEDEYNAVICGSTTDLEGKASFFHWRDDQLEVRHMPNARLSTKINTLSTDEAILVKQDYRQWYGWSRCAIRRDNQSQINESIEEILKSQNLLPKGWLLEDVNAISSNGVFMAGFGKKDGQRKIWMATIPRSHIPVAPKPSFCQKIQSAVYDWTFQALGAVFLRITKYISLPI